MKIAFFMSTILEQGGGLEKYLIETSKNLCKNPNIKIDIITMDENFTLNLIKILNFYYFKKISGNDIYRETTESVKQRLGNAGYIKLKNFKSLKEVLSNYDLIYSKNEILEAFIFKFFVGFKNIPPIIFGVHTPHFYPITKSIQSKIHNLLYCSKFYNFLCSGVNSFHVSNTQSKSILEKQFKNRKVFLINYPFDVENFPKIKPEKEFYFEKKKDKINILWLARLSEQKGVDDLINLILKINNSSLKNKVFWHIAGTGEEIYENSIKKIAKTFDNVNYYGHIVNQNVPTVLKNVDLFLSTSKWEVSPYNILEAQSLNLPVISYKIAGPEDIIVENKTGLLCKDLDCMYISIINFVENEYKFSNISEQINLKFSPNVIYPKIVEMFKQVTNK